MAAKDLLDSGNAKNSKPAADMNNTRSNDTNSNQKKHGPCKNSLPT
ncbi:hypothetical protein SRRS_21330 [Sporomusa rhizae]